MTTWRSTPSGGRDLVPLRVDRRPAGLVPFGLGSTKPRHFREMARIAWENRRHPLYAWRVLTRGVCDGCALGTSGLSDWTIDGTHLCLVRLNLLKLNTLDPFAPEAAADVERLRALDSRALRDLGRIPAVLRRRRGERGFTRISWDEALGELSARMRRLDPDRMALYLTSRGIGNEVYYAAQKAWRFLGSPHVENAARLCHSPSTAAMKSMLGLAASTCSYRDWIGTDVLVLFGSNVANDQPVSLKYILEAKKRGTRVISVNTYAEPGLSRYWVPSNAGSAIFGSRITDRFVRVGPGGDLALLLAVQKLLVERGQIDRAFLDAHTDDPDGWIEHLGTFGLDDLIRRSGASRADVEALAEVIGAARTGVFVWSMGLTQHAHGTATVQALLALGLLKGFVGREKCGLMPIRGHSGVQGGAEMGAYATAFPGGAAVTPEEADRLAGIWGFRPPDRPGMDTVAMIEAAARGHLDLFFTIGGNFLETMPQPRRVEEALARVPVRIHQDIVLTKQMLVDPAEVVYLFPARTRYEHRCGITETTTERRVIFSPHVPGHEVPQAKEEWWPVVELAKMTRPEAAAAIDFADGFAIRRDIAATIPAYRGIEKLARQGDQFQWGGPHLAPGGVFPLPGGRARFVRVAPPAIERPEGAFFLATRRGKQFNSMVQKEVDALTGAARDHVFIAPDDAQRLGLVADQPIVLRSAHGEMHGRVFLAEVAPGSVQAHWPEANVLIGDASVDPSARVPDYNAWVTIHPVRAQLPAPREDRVAEESAA